MVALKSQGVKVIQMYPEEDMHVCTKFPGDPPDSRDISLQTTNVNLMVRKSQGITPSGDHEPLYIILC